MIKKFHDPELDEHYISNERVFSGRLLKVELDHVKLPNGSESTREYIRHPGAVAIVPVLEDGSIVLVKQCRYPLGTVMWEIPAGKLEKGEDPFFAAVRELEEETGFKSDCFIKLGEYWPTVGYCTETVHLYLAKMLTKGETHFDNDEFISLVKMPFEQAYQMCMDNTICDGKSQLAILKAKNYL